MVMMVLITSGTIRYTVFLLDRPAVESSVAILLRLVTIPTKTVNPKHGLAAVFIIIIMIKRISRAIIYHTKQEHRALYNNTD